MKYIIIGAVAGGASTAARLRRLDEHAQILLFEKGEYISYANCGLPYYIGNVIKERQKLLVQTAAAFHQRFHIDVRIQSEVTAIDPKTKTVTVFDHANGKEYTESYDKLVLSPGAEPVRPPLPGIQLEGIFTLRNVKDTDHVKAYVLQKGIKRAVIIGAGFIGLEMAENLHHLGMDVSVVEMADQVLAPLDIPLASIAQRELRSNGVKLNLKNAVQSFTKEANGLAVHLGGGETLGADIVLLSIGVRPDTRLLENTGIKTGASRGIVVNEFLQTSEPDIYAVGDAIEFVNPVTGQSMNTYLAGPANKQGRICANNIALGNVHRYKGSVNTAIVKVFDLTVATTGVASKQLKKSGIAHLVSTISAGSHAGYFPGAKQMTIQLAFAPDSGRIFGAQIAGYDGVDKRIDVLSRLIQTNGTVYDLTEFEQAYAPPFSSAKDPLNMAGFVAENILTGKLSIFYWDQLADVKPGDVLLDVRSPEEFGRGHIPGAVNIPVDEMRDRLNELDPKKNIFIYCQAGLRGYIAQRMLKQRGYEHVLNMSGGYQLWQVCTEESLQQHVTA